MKIDIDLNKITDLSTDVKNALLQNKREIASLNRKIESKNSQIDKLKEQIGKSSYQLEEFEHFKSVMQNFFDLFEKRED